MDVLDLAQRDDFTNGAFGAAAEGLPEAWADAKTSPFRVVAAAEGRRREWSAGEGKGEGDGEEGSEGDASGEAGAGRGAAANRARARGGRDVPDSSKTCVTHLDSAAR